MASSVDDDHTIGSSVPGSNKAQLVCDLLSVEESGGGNFIHEEETHLGDDEEDTILWAILHQHWEVTVLLHLQVGRSLDLLLTSGWVADFHDVDFLGAFTRFLLAEAEEGVLVLGGICDWHISESGSETLENLLLSLFDEEKLHVAANGLIGSLVDTNQVAPFSGCIDTVVHDLASAELGLLLENLLWGIGLVNVGVINICFADDTKGIFVDPSPEPNGLIDLALLHFGLGIKVKDLNDSFGSLSGSQGDNVLRSVHEDTLGFHGFTLESKVFCRVNDGTISLILDTNVFLTFKGHGAELEELRVQAQVFEIEHLLKVEWQVLI
jgi:hypothetical protein